MRRMEVLHKKYPITIFMLNLILQIIGKVHNFMCFSGSGPFNRGKLMNVGFVEAKQIREFDCFVFHDVDLIPEDDRNMYSCPEQPRHMSVAVDTFKYK